MMMLLASPLPFKLVDQPAFQKPAQPTPSRCSNRSTSFKCCLTITSSDTGEATVNSPLTFTNANWDTPQTVTVTGINENIVDGTITSTITIAVDDANSDNDFDSVDDETVSATTTDDDVAGYHR